MRNIAVCLLTAVIVAAGLSVPAFGATQTHTASVPLQRTNWSRTVSIPQFDPSLGTLLSVGITLAGHAEGTSFFENLGPNAATVISKLCAEITLTNSTPITAAIPVLERTDNVGPFDGTIDFGGASGMTIGGLMADASSSATMVSPADLAPFVGTNTVSLSAAAVGKSSVTGPGNLASGSQTLASAVITVVYDYEPFASVGDRVWFDTNGDGVQDPGEMGINGVTVLLKDYNGNVVATDTTAGDGIYLFEGLVPGSYTVCLDGGTLPAGLTQTYELDGTLNGCTAVTLNAGDARTDVDFGFWTPPANGAIGDLVWIDSDADGLYEPAVGELGVNGVVVELYDAVGNPIGTTSTSNSPVTGEPGWYLFHDLPQGGYTVQVAASNFAVGGPLYGFGQTYDYDGFLDNQTLYSLAAGETFLGADFGYRPVCPPGTGTPGYWKNHPEAWPVESITIGGVTYSKAQAIAFLKGGDGDKSLTLFRALVCAKLNVGMGNEFSCVETTIIAADEWMATYGPAGSGVKAKSAAWKIGEPLYLTLDEYNNGLLCAQHRD